jgi:hypothetical protein
MRECPRHYGISNSQPFSSFRHSEDDAYIDPFDGEKKARGQMTWLLKKGDVLLSNKPKHAEIDICRRFGLKDNKVFKSNLVALDDDKAPQRYAELPIGSSMALTLRLQVVLTEFDSKNECHSAHI